MDICSNATMDSSESQLSKHGMNNSTVDSNTPPVNNALNQILSEGSRCFVCDVTVQGRYYALATCRTQSSRARVIEKLGELVGERYLVVISEDDVICRGCANLMNTLDRLETEMRGVRGEILRFLERKYSLEEGELLDNSDIVKPCQPPQITKSQTQTGGSYHRKKRAAVSCSEVSSDGNKQKKSNNVWMQCDKCRYTTRYNAFMVHHIRQHIKQRITCDKCGAQIKTEQSVHICKEIIDKNEIVALSEGDDNTKELPTIEAFPMDTVVTSNGEKEAQVSIATVLPNQQVENEPKEDNSQFIRLASPDDLQLQSIVTSDEARTGHEVYVQVLQHIGDEDGVPQIAVEAGTSAGMVVKVNESSGKQMLTLAEDGSLEMVEVACWDDVHSSHSNPDVPF